MTPRLLTLTEAAAALGIDEPKDPAGVVLRLIRRGKLDGVPVSKYMKVEPRAIQEYIERERVRATAQRSERHRNNRAGEYSFELPGGI